MKFSALKVRRVMRKEDTIQVSLSYTGSIHSAPSKYNKVFATALRAIADAIENVDDAFVDPEIVVWTHKPGRLAAEAVLSPKQ